MTSKRESEPLRATVDIQRGTDRRHLELDGLALVPIDGAPCRVRLPFPSGA